MRKHGFTNVVAAAAMAIAFAGTARAQNARSFIATTGNDVNNCTASAFCRTLARALTVTNPAGEIVVVDSGGYGVATIAQPVNITAIGIDASILATSGNALTISTAGNVTITGLNLYGDGLGTDGILVTQVGFLRLYDMHIENFANDGIQFMASGGALAVYGSKINDCGHDGLLLQASGGRAYVHNSEFDNNQFAGADSATGLMTVADSSAHYNTHGFVAGGGRMELYGDRAVFNVNAFRVNATGHLYFADCLVSDNSNAYNVDTGGVLSGSNPGTTLIVPGQGTVGTLSAAQPLF